MPRTLYGYILRELLKLLVASTVVLVVLLSVGFSIKPISEGLLGPWQLVKVLTYTMPGMLTFALPFAAAFAGTMVFFRMSADNEITACAAGGVSYRGLLAPVAGLGLALTLAAFFLSNWIVPQFWRLVAEQVEQDVASVVVKRIQKGEVVELGGLILYADRVRQDVPFEASTEPGGPTQYDRLVLDGVAVGKLSGGEYALEADYTAERAVVDLYRDRRRERVYATMMLTNATVNDPQSGTLGTTRRQPIEAQEIPSPFKQEPKFLSLHELGELAEHPQRSADVREAKSGLSEALARRRLLDRMRDQLRGPGGKGGGKLRLAGPRGKSYTIRSPRARLGGGGLRLSAVGAEKVAVVEHEAGETTQRMMADAARLEVEADTLTEEPQINLVLESVAVYKPSLPAPSRLRELTLPLLKWREPVLAPLRAAPVAELVQAAKQYPSSRVANRSRHLGSVVVGLVREIRSQLHERAATAVNIPLVLLLGTVMSMWLRRQVPLVIFFFCFIPTVAAFLTISSGQNMMQWDGMPLALGIAMAWSGNAALAAIVLGVYLRLRRN